jgi:hypothetical protein
MFILETSFEYFLTGASNNITKQINIEGHLISWLVIFCSGFEGLTMTVFHVLLISCFRSCHIANNKAKTHMAKQTLVCSRVVCLNQK